LAIKAQKRIALKILLGMVVVLILGFSFYYVWTHWPRHEVIQTVKEFYDDEQGGDYGSAWTLLHPQIKKKFTQADYIEKRTTLFMDDYGVKGFSYKIDDVDHLKKWRVNADSPYLKDVYRVTVIQSFTGIFGKAQLYKDVYVAKDQGEWKILWEY